MKKTEISFGKINTESFRQAVEVLEMCKVQEQCYGFQYPFFSPGGQYGAQWWQLDGSIALDGYKWLDQEFAEKGIRNFIVIQREDGRIPLFGTDSLPLGSARQREGTSSLPELLRAAFKIAQRSTDKTFLRDVYKLMTSYLNWWQKNRLDIETGLLTSVFEETFVPYKGAAGEYAAVDTNVEVALGYERAALLAEQLERPQEEIAALRQKGRELFAAVQRWLWQETEGYFMPYFVQKRESAHVMTAQGFFAFADTAMPTERKVRMLNLLKKPDAFGWGKIPLTSVAQTDDTFTITHGVYQGNLSWSGMVWSLINYNVADALERAGEWETSAELAYATVRLFCGQYSEFADPFDGSPHGVQNYAWTAAHCILLLIEHLFGVHYDAWKNCVTISPNIPVCLTGQRLSLCGLALPCGGSLDIYIQRTDANCEVTYIQHETPVPLRVICKK